MAVTSSLKKLRDVVRAHRKALVDVEPVDAGSQTVLHAVDTLLEIEELKLEAQLDKLVAAQKREAVDLAAYEPRGRRRYRSH